MTVALNPLNPVILSIPEKHNKYSGCSKGDREFEFLPSNLFVVVRTDNERITINDSL